MSRENIIGIVGIVYLAIGLAVIGIVLFVDDYKCGLMKAFIEGAEEAEQAYGMPIVLSDKAMAAIYTILLFVFSQLCVFTWPKFIPEIPYYVGDAIDIVKAKIKK